MRELTTCLICGDVEFGRTWRGGRRGVLYRCGTWVPETGERKQGSLCAQRQLAKEAAEKEGKE